MTNLSDTLPDRVTESRWSVFDAAQVSMVSPPSEVPDHFRSGQQIVGTPWIVVRPVGRGGVGEVFEVEHELLGRRAAFKVLHRDNLFRRGLADRVVREGRFLASVRHANIVDVFDMGVLPDARPFVVLELLDGRDLRAESNRLGVLSVPAALDIVSQVLRGLSALHEAGIVHRDIKLENLFLCADGHVEILDLGAAERMGENVEDRPPSLGTPRTMAPEQYNGQPVDGRADLYALGIVLYELIAGRGPFDDASGIDALRFAHCRRLAPPPSTLAPQLVPPEIDALVLRVLAKSPDERFVSAHAMALEIAALRAVPLPASFPTRPSLDTECSAPPRASVTVPSAWAIRQPWSAIFSALKLKPMESPSGIFVIAILALAVASLAFGVAAGRLLLPFESSVRFDPR